MHSDSIYLNQTELLRISRTNFSEAFQLLVHLKVLRLFVESVLRYGLPVNYIGLAIKVCASTYSKTTVQLTQIASDVAGPEVMEENSHHTQLPFRVPCASIEQQTC